MRLLRKGLRVIAAGALAVAVGVAVNQILNGGRWNLRWLVAAVVLAALSEGLDLWLGAHGGGSGPSDPARPVLWPNLAGEDGMPLLLSEVSPTDLGVHPSRFGTEGDSPYIRRGAADDLLTAALADREKQVIIVEGPRLAGATSTLAQAVQTCLPDYLAAGFTPDPRVPLRDMISQAGRWAAAQGRAAGAVVWLDGLTPDRFIELARVPLGDLPPRVRLLATLDTGVLDGLRVPEQLNALLDQHAARVRLGTITEQERRDLLAAGPYEALRPLLEEKEDLFLGKVMVAWGPLRVALARGGSEQAVDRMALLRAVTDWYRVPMPRLLNHDILSYLYGAYRRELTGAAPGSPISTAEFTDALRWAMKADTADRPRLVDQQAVPGGQRYAPYPLLTVIADDSDEDVSWPISDVLWGYANHYFHGDQRRDIGYSALAREARHAAAVLLSHADTTVAPAAYGHLGQLFYANAEWANSRHWWRQTVSTGHHDLAPHAMLDLGILEAERGDPDQARHWYRQAINTGHHDYAPGAMINLASLEAERGDPDQARHWWQQAINTGHHDYAPGAMRSLGMLEYEQGNPDQTRHWWRQTVSTGHHDHAPHAMLELGILENERGNPDQARYWYQQAINTGHPDHAPGAMINLASLEGRQGNPGQARHWWQQAINTGHPDHAPGAMYDLGILEHEQGNPLQARHWCQQALNTGHPDHAPGAMFNLGVLEHEQGNPDQARHWYLQAINTGHHDYGPRAMINLGILEGRQGNPGQARHWWQQALSTGHPKIIDRAERELRDYDRQEEEQQRAKHFGRYGYLVHADPTLMNRNNQRPETPEPAVADHSPGPDEDGVG